MMVFQEIRLYLSFKNVFGGVLRLRKKMSLRKKGAHRLLGLRRIRKTDLTVLFDARNDPGVYKWCRQYAPLHWSGHEAWYNWQATSKDCEMFAVERLDSGYNLSDPVGVCGLTSIDYINSRGEFSLYIIS